MKLIEKHKCFNGHQEIYSHNSISNNCLMQFGLFTPDKIENTPVLYFLSGITCTEQNFIQKSGYQKFASENKIAVVVPDTSPRGDAIP
ncbi:alpha/beta hydrolase-fold protein, partial [Alphaproteobacteria bacterium]|nr:alpha/beta hydrolase-fold protein [Alphaproteobacteria bacterium]